MKRDERPATTKRPAVPVPAQITVATVRRWIRDKATKWPRLPDSDLKSIALACNAERKRLQIQADMDAHDGELFQSISASLKAARNAAGVLKKEITYILRKTPATSKGLGEMTFPLELEAKREAKREHHMCVALEALKQIMPCFEPVRPQGGQSAVWGDFTDRLAIHLQVSLCDLGEKAPIHDDSPLVLVLTEALYDVYGLAGRSDITAAAVASRLNRVAKKRRAKSGS